MIRSVIKQFQSTNNSNFNNSKYLIFDLKYSSIEQYHNIHFSRNIRNYIKMQLSDKIIECKDSMNLIL
jgi:hypothetical protein